jgi:hypothetical protein
MSDYFTQLGMRSHPSMSQKNVARRVRPSGYKLAVMILEKPVKFAISCPGLPAKRELNDISPKIPSLRFALKKICKCQIIAPINFYLWHQPPAPTPAHNRCSNDSEKTIDVSAVSTQCVKYRKNKAITF